MSFLPEGLSVGESKDVVETITICQADDAGPVFELDVKVLPIKEYRKIFRKLGNADNANPRAQQTLQDKVDKDYIAKVIKGGRGLTVANWEETVCDGKGLEGDDIDEWRKTNREIEVTTDVVFYLYRNSWPQNFGNKIFETVQGGFQEAEEDEDDLKND